MHVEGVCTSQLNTCVSVLPQREGELELLVASTNSMCACILTPLGGWSRLCALLRKAQFTQTNSYLPHTYQ